MSGGFLSGFFCLDTTYNLVRSSVFRFLVFLVLRHLSCVIINSSVCCKMYLCM